MSSRSYPREQLLAGVEILAPTLRTHGFVFELEAEGTGSGGPFARGTFKKDNRFLDLHFRYSLGLVRYHINQESLDHETYMHLLGVHGRSRYPGFPKEPLDSFRDLASDIAMYCSDFTIGDGQQFLVLASRSKQNPMMFRGIS